MLPKCTTEDLANPDFGYFYCPSFPAAIVFTVLFALTTIVHLIQAIHYRKKFCWVLIMAGIWETAGLTFRVLSVLHPTSQTFAFPSQLLILLAPIWINAFDYVVMSRVVYCFGDQRVLGIGARRLALVFVLLDITAFLMQAAGGSFTNNEDPKVVLMGLHIYMGGIGLQECFVLLFIGVVTRFHYKMLHPDIASTSAHAPTPSSHPFNPLDSAESQATRPAPGAWKRAVYPMYASLALITLRIIFRLVEFSSGVVSPITQTEVPFYVLEALPMFVALSLWNVWHPGQVLVGPDSEFPKLSRAQKRAEKAKQAEKN
ncbi:RTA1 like protein-domain-containing protein [Mycena rebaudengoi]|nr:RTA1 like protein-domain-containing protein [Mycena rebaudengoi]